MAHFLALVWHANNPGPGYVRFDIAVGLFACELAWLWLLTGGQRFTVTPHQPSMIHRIIWTG